MTAAEMSADPMSRCVMTATTYVKMRARLFGVTWWEYILGNDVNFIGPWRFNRASRVWTREWSVLRPVVGLWYPMPNGDTDLRSSRLYALRVNAGTGEQWWERTL